jgi:Nuclease-related domain/AAA domain
VGAGASARAEAERQRRLAAAYEQAALEATRKAQTFGVAGRTEAQTAQALAPLAALAYHQLNDRAWPGSKRANVDLLMVGPSGVYVIDTKCWADPRVEDARLFNGEAPADDEVDKLLRLTELVEQSVAEVGLPPLEVVPVLVFAGRKGITEQLGRVQLLGDKDLLAHCARRGNRLTNAQVERLLARLMADFPPYGTEPAADLPDVEVSLPVMREPVVPAIEAAVQDALDGMDDPAELLRAVLEAALAEPIEDWMTFLHPDQARLVRRSFNGPARIRGGCRHGQDRPRPAPRRVPGGDPAGADPLRDLRADAAGGARPAVRADGAVDRGPGGVHRPAPLGAGPAARPRPRRPAERPGRREGVPDRVVPGRQARPAGPPEHALGLLARGDRPRHQGPRADLVRAVRGSRPGRPADPARPGAAAGRLGPLLRVRAAAARPGRVGLQRRAAAGPGGGAAPAAGAGYVGVVVDEVQDLNRVGVQLLHALVGDAPDGLLLIGDGQQAVYPGGFTLIEAGVAVSGRAAVLRVNYRNTAEILS